MILIPSGNQTVDSIERRTRSLQILKDILDKFRTNLNEMDSRGKNAKEKTTRGRRKEKYEVDLEAAIECVGSENPFDIMGSRSFAGFKNFKADLNILVDSTKYHQKLKSMSQVHDSVRIYQTERHTGVFEGDNAPLITSNLEDEEDDEAVQSSEELDEGELEQGVTKDLDGYESFDEGADESEDSLPELDSDDELQFSDDE